jgi:hypothetical protein
MTTEIDCGVSINGVPVARGCDITFDMAVGCLPCPCGCHRRGTHRGRSPEPRSRGMPRLFDARPIRRLDVR